MLTLFISISSSCFTSCPFLLLLDNHLNNIFLTPSEFVLGSDCKHNPAANQNLSIIKMLQLSVRLWTFFKCFTRCVTLQVIAHSVSSKYHEHGAMMACDTRLIVQQQFT